MKNKKNYKTIYIFAVITIFVLFLSVGYGAIQQTLSINGHASLVSESDFVYVYHAYNDTVTITEYNGVSKNVLVPSQLGGYPVSQIDKYAFDSKDLDAVVISEGIKDIFFGAFSNNKLTSIIIPTSVKEIGNRVFENNNIQIVSFKGVIPPVLGSELFFRNYHLVNICIPSTADEVTWQKTLMAAGVTADVSIIKGKSGACGEIGTGEVTGPPALNCGTNAYQKDNECLCFDQYEGDPYVMCSLRLDLTCFVFSYQGWSKYNVIQGYNCDNKEISIPDVIDGVISGKINKDAFISKGLNKIILNKSLQIIDMYAFKNNNLKTITIPAKVTSIVLNAFTNNKLESVIFKGTKPPTMNTNCFTINPDLKKICVPPGTTAVYKNALNNSGIPLDAVIYENEQACKIVTP
ncbi:MAG: leucine-rich repeat protein [Bacilli bacterium]